MKIAFFSNFLNHHQLPLCLALNEMQDVEFVFVACEKITDERIGMGYEDMNEKYPFVVRAYEDYAEAEKIATEYDVAIFGSSPNELLALRMRENKLSFRFCERSLKKGAWRRFIPKTRKKINEGYVNYKDKNLYVLGSGAFVSSDLSLCGFRTEKCFKWGYFPAVENESADELLSIKSKNERAEILYAGRFLELKRVMDTLVAVRMLVDRGITKLHLTLIGDGEQKPRLVEYVRKNGLSDFVTFLPFVPSGEVRGYMNAADIYVFGSDFREGWGAVVNEAMSAACACVVSHAVGCAAFLIENGKNGYVYPCGSTKSLSKILGQLVCDPELRARVGRAANETVNELWCAKVATERLVELCRSLAEGGGAPQYESGPCSSAEVIRNNWINNRRR